MQGFQKCYGKFLEDRDLNRCRQDLD
jgi:hypothetical protein